MLLVVIGLSLGTFVLPRNKPGLIYLYRFMFFFVFTLRSKLIAKLQVHEDMYTYHFCNYVLILIPDILHIAYRFKDIGLGILILFLGNHIYN